MEQCCQTPLEDLLSRLPINYCIDLIEPFSSTHIPIGKHCHEAVILLRDRKTLINQNEKMETALRKVISLFDKDNKCRELYVGHIDKTLKLVEEILLDVNNRLNTNVVTDHAQI